MPFIPHTHEQTQAMLELVGVRTLDDLFVDIVPSMRPKSFNLPEGLSEMEVMAHFNKLAAKNTAVESFLGAGFYEHYIPAAVDFLSSRGEFYTAYTPYQAESSQGTLQAIFEYQTAVCRLFDMECANASVYDGGTALFEGLMMAIRTTNRHKIVLDEGVNPLWRNMLASYTSNLELEIITVKHENGRSNLKALAEAIDNDCAAIIVQYPNFFGSIQDLSELFAQAKIKGTLSIVSVNPVMQAVLKTPGEMGADIAVADGQSLGLPLSFGGPYLGIMTCKKSLIRQFPGRIVGRTTDVDGKTAYVLTLQAREQHIRRAKATSNICSNQALCALRSLIYLCLLGPEGLKRTAELSMNMARYAADKLCALPGVSLLNDAPFGYEFAVKLPKKAKDIIEKMVDKGVLAGFNVSRYYSDMDNVLLLACTEMKSKEQVDQFISGLRGVL